MGSRVTFSGRTHAFEKGLDRSAGISGEDKTGAMLSLNNDSPSKLENNKDDLCRVGK